MSTVKVHVPNVASSGIHKKPTQREPERGSIVILQNIRLNAATKINENKVSSGAAKANFPNATVSYGLSTVLKPRKSQLKEKARKTSFSQHFGDDHMAGDHDIVQHRIHHVIKTDNRYVPTQDVAAQVKFLGRSQQRQANLQAYAYGPSKKPRLEGPSSAGNPFFGSAGHSSSEYTGRSQLALRAQHERINQRDMMILLEQDRTQHCSIISTLQQLSHWWYCYETMQRH